MGKEYWVTTEGKEIDIDEMDLQHLRNVLKMIIRNNREAMLQRLKKRLMQEAVLNGEMANAFNDAQSFYEDEDQQETYSEYLTRKGDDQ